MGRVISNLNNFDQITIALASPERIRDWSYGEITRPETINYRTGRSERGGLFDERIFGPEKDFECYCGKYRRIRYKDIICEKCGVEVTRSIVRRERSGHIDLAAPVAHIWFLRGVPSRMSLLLSISVSDLEKVIYFAGYIVTKVNEEERARILKSLESEYKEKLKATKDAKDKEKLKDLYTKKKKEIQEIVINKVFNEAMYHYFSLKFGTIFEAKIGAEAVYNILQEMDLEKVKKDLEEALLGRTKADRPKMEKRLSLIKGMIRAGTRPEWMFITALPVIPAALRPMVALEGGRHATSDLNDLYRRVINRNNRLKKLKEIGAPEVILRNEKRILQEAIDALIDNSIAREGSAQAMSSSQRRALKSLADNLKGKRGLFRQNLLGKRVDYSGRSVIVVGPQLSLDQCGLPKHMALELFRPFIIAKILERELAFNIRGANKLIEEGVPEVWAILEEVIAGKYVLLNRAPTLHRLSIQAFRPVLIEGNAIQLHPMVCSAFNADFDGDQMAVYLPLSKEAQEEARELMAANKNLLKPQNGEPIIVPKLDIILGCYWMTRIVANQLGEDKIFSRPNHAITAHDNDIVSLRAKIKVLGTDSPKYKQYEGKPFETSIGRLLFNSCLPSDYHFINEEINSKRMSTLIDDLIRNYGFDRVAPILDKIKNFGYQYVTIAGITWGIDSVTVPVEKKALVLKGRKEEAEIMNQWHEGLLSTEEKREKIIELWIKVKAEIEKFIPGALEPEGGVFNMLYSGARGSITNLSQMAGMKGLIVNPVGDLIEFPVIPSYKEGLSPIEYFITTHGSRKGLADTALKTAEAGYLTRRLVDVAQDVVITEEDCGTEEGFAFHKENIGGLEIPISRKIFGRILHEAVKVGRKVLFEAGTLITKEIAKEIEAAGVLEAVCRTPLACKTLHGHCRKCYGLDLGRNRLVDLGEAVGIVAAQAIGEPGTQLTLRTFHAGGVAGGADITMGLPRIVEVFERRTPRNPAIVSEAEGTVSEISVNENERTIVVVGKDKEEKKYTIAYRREPIVKIGQKVSAGELLTDGSAVITEIFQYGGEQKAGEYIINEIAKVYELQGAATAAKHIEVIVGRMFSRRKIKDPGDTIFATGDIIETIELADENEKVKKSGGAPATAEVVVLGISEVSLSTKSWLSSSSFQNTNRVLIQSAVRGGVDTLRGLKENVIVGRLVPAGTGFKGKGK
ncbi:DNA-directed RNA polymerase subunit beta' [Candidatus Nomurabacteria bacterium RIFCSPHIGHO2_01_FULL_39_9]|uniref:DNA-directed RNA polymerase subunit beta' n=1 Tax=Candidatus Nomurabacteria bacterium RIFCSPHIGHO2_01_FULL_39_9 TaxID=1801735 RepID=A0A1F6UVW3_9BACT|nr:MAG: DNA-directed RNA polymerase subunit beta' [Candidatus Nomurabacteria bacterium RIFCSPHIGHO2_01_FULL_39_9]